MGIGVRRIVSIFPYASTRALSWTVHCEARGPWNQPRSKPRRIYCSMKYVSWRGRPRPKWSRPRMLAGRRLAYSSAEGVPVPVLGLMFKPGTERKPQEARRWFFVAARMAIRILIVFSVSARSAAVVPGVVGMGPPTVVGACGAVV